MERDKKKYLETIEAYAQIIKNLPSMLDNADDTFLEISNKMGISFSALSNKKYGRRDWKMEEIGKLILIIGNIKQREIVKNYVFIVNDIFPIIRENGIQFKFIFEKAGMNMGNYQVRSKNIATWRVSEVREIISILKF